MKSFPTGIAVALAIFVGLDIGVAFSQRPPSKRNFEAEINKALESAKTAAGFEFLGTLVRTCLLPQSGGENLTDELPAYIAKPGSARSGA